MIFSKAADLLRLEEEGRYSTIYAAVLEQECAVREVSIADVYCDMEAKLKVMEASLERGLNGVRSYSGLTGFGAKRLNNYIEEGRALCPGLFATAIRNAIAINEVNAAMGIICATPTAGSAGVVPAILLAARDQLKLSRKDQLNFLLTAGACGLIIGNQACLSGAEGGCQAEIGSASAMAAAALAEAAGAPIHVALEAMAIALQNILGLACDPVAGLVEIPCIKRNAMGVANALAASEMALAGLVSEIPPDEVILAMGRVGDSLPNALRETALGGLAMCPTALKMAAELRAKKQVHAADA